MISLLASAAREIELAASRPASEVESALSRIAEMMADLPAFAKTCSKNERDKLRVQVVALRTCIAKLNRVMERSSEMFRGYARRAGSSSAEYTPGGIAEDPRDPAFISFSM